jgi:predicted RNA-binding Zn ribbon-like protein
VVAVEAADVELVLAFLNTVDVEEGTDLLDDVRAWREWVEGRELGDPGCVDDVRCSRDALRAAVTHASEPPTGRQPAAPDAAEPPVAAAGALASLPAVRLEVTLRDGVPALAAADAVGKVLAAAVRLSVSGEWERVKICPADDCRWAFYDRSRNRSRSWCSMSVCGNREKARQFRQRLRGDPTPR